MRGDNNNIEEIVNNYLSKFDFEVVVNKCLDKRKKAQDIKNNTKLSNEVTNEINDLCAEIYRANEDELSLNQISTICRYIFKKGVEYANNGSMQLIYDSRKGTLK